MFPLPCLGKSFDCWTSADIADFYENAERIAADGDARVKNPVLHEFACELVERRQGVMEGKK